MRWSDTPGSVADIVLYVIAIIVVVIVTVTLISWENETRRERNSREYGRSPQPHRNIVLQGAGWLAGFVTVIMLGTFLFSRIGPTPDTGVSNAQLAANLGLISGQSYPLQLGDKTGSINGTAEASSGLFYASASVTFKPDTLVSIGFRAGDKSYILSVPTGKIEFTKSDGPESMKLILGGMSPNSGYTEDGKTGSGDYWGYKLSYCDYQFVNLAPTCIKTAKLTELHLSGKSKLLRIGDIVTNSIQAATITLTQAHFDALVGTPGE